MSESCFESHKVMIMNNTNPQIESPVYSQAPMSHKPRQTVEFNFFDLLTIMKRQWGLIIFGMLFCVVLGVLYYAKAQRLYKSESQLFIIERNASIAVDPGASSYTNVQDSLLSTHVMILQSNMILSEAYASLKAKDNPDLENLHSQGNKIKYIKDNLKTTKGGDGKLKSAMILTVSFTSPSPQESEAVLSAIIKTYMDYVQKEYSDPTETIAELHKESKAEFERLFAKLTEDVANFRQEHPEYLSLSTNVTTTQHLLSKNMDKESELGAKLKELESQLASLEKSSRSDSINESDVLGAILAHISSDSSFGFMKDIIKGELFTSNSEVQRMTDFYRTQVSATFTELLKNELLLNNYLVEGVGGPEGPNARQARQSIVFLEDKLEQIKQQERSDAIRPYINSNFDLLTTLKNRTTDSITIIENQLEEVQAKIVQLKDELRTQGNLDMEYQDFQTQRTFTLDKINQITNTLEDLSKVKSSGGLNVDQIEKPILAEKPVWPSLIIILGLSVVAGMMLGGVLAYLVDLMDRTFHSPVEIGNMVGSPVLAQLPKLHMVARRRKWLRSPKKPGFIASEIVAHHKPKSPEAEVFRGLRTSLLVGMKMQNKTVLQITSTNPHDGKTTISTNLAVSIANSNRRVLLIDGDLRSPNLHSIFGIANGTGLSNYLHEEKQFDDVLLTTPVENLTLVTAGTNRTNPAEILSSPLFKKFLDEAREKFDIIVLDTPPVLAVSDTCIMASEADNVLLVVRAVKNGRPSVMHAAYLLREVGANICGIAVNAFRSHRFYNTHGDSRESYGYGYGYGGYGYGYGYGYGNAYGYGSTYGYGDDSDNEKPSRKSRQTADVS